VWFGGKECGSGGVYGFRCGCALVRVHAFVRACVCVCVHENQSRCLFKGGIDGRSSKGSVCKCGFEGTGLKKEAWIPLVSNVIKCTLDSLRCQGSSRQCAGVKCALCLVVGRKIQKVGCGARRTLRRGVCVETEGN